MTKVTISVSESTEGDVTISHREMTTTLPTPTDVERGRIRGLLNRALKQIDDAYRLSEISEPAEPAGGAE